MSLCDVFNSETVALVRYDVFIMSAMREYRSVQCLLMFIHLVCRVS